MDLDIHYPYSIPFYTDTDFVSVKFSNNEDHIINIYFVKGDILGGLAGMIFPHTTRKYQFPKDSIITIITDKKPHKFHCFIKLIDGMTYIYP
jgi:hypothetical protein|tara:strand:+ start:563 stop:838 length:276 start_codon:yes stop_codon:yes gene_type:complete